MQRTLDNLDRLTDLREELERNLSHLKRQAQAAERYAEYKAEERELKRSCLRFNGEFRLASRRGLRGK